MAHDEKHVSLALGSGGARGLAQIGIIRWLEENREFRIKSIAGSSMGAVVGGIYAAGKLDIYEEWVCSLTRRDVFRLLDFAFSWSGLFSGERLMEKLRDMLGEANIEDLPIAFTAVATDVEKGREVWLSEGALFDAIRASMAIPTVFTPVVINGRTLVDGGLVNPVPIAPTLRQNGDLTIAVSLSGREEEGMDEDSFASLSDDDKEPGRYQKAIGEFLEGLQEKLGMEAENQRSFDMFDLISRSIETMQNSITRYRMAAYEPEGLVEIPVNACGIFDFHRAREMIDLGYERAERALRHL
jgi:NTE family protein